MTFDADDLPLATCWWDEASEVLWATRENSLERLRKNGSEYTQARRDYNEKRKSDPIWQSKKKAYDDKQYQKRKLDPAWVARKKAYDRKRYAARKAQSTSVNPAVRRA